MKNFTFPTLNKSTVTLRELLEKYDLLIVNVYYNDCIYCKEEAPVLKKIMNKYEKIGFVCINKSDGKDQTLSGLENIYHFDLDRVYLVCNKTNPVLSKIKGADRVPRNFFIDKEGYVSKLTGGLSEEWMERIIKFNTTESREVCGTLYSAAEKKEPATLCPIPEADISKRRY